MFFTRICQKYERLRKRRKILSLCSLHTSILWWRSTHSSLISLTFCYDNNHINLPRIVSTLALRYVALFIITLAPVGRSCILLNHLHPLDVCHLFTFTHVAKIIRNPSFSPVSHSSLYNPLGSTCAHSPRVSSDRNLEYLSVNIFLGWETILRL